YMYIHYIAKSIDTPPSNELASTFSLRSAKKNWEDDKSKAHPEKDKAHCLWDSITMTMKQITPTKKIDKIEGWEPDSSPLSSPLSLSLPHSLGLPSWVGLGSEEDSSRYASLTESQTGGPAQWAARARDKLAAVRRRSPASLSENNWEGLK
uniref:Testis development related protein n=1 Tax=Cyprinus carpio TaxID=7962 RepID=A0A8C1G388_CYPCA